MPAPDLIAPDRLEELLGGALPEGEREARLQGLVRALRAEAPPAPPTLVERVREIGEQPPRRPRVFFLPRRQALALAALVLCLGAFAGFLSTVEGGGDDAESADAPAAAAADVTVEEADLAPPVAAEPDSGDPAHKALGDGSRFDRDTLGGEASRSGAVPELSTGRATDVALWMEVRLADSDELSAAANESMAIARQLGGWVAASEIDTQGREGRAELALRVPVSRVEDAIVELGGLGTVTGQQVETEDLQAAIDRRETRIDNLRRAIRVLELRLETEDLTPAEELNLRLEIERRESLIDDLRRGNRQDRREAATSELALVLHTREAPATRGEDESGAAGAADDALRFLADAGAIALFLAIVLSPVVLIAVLLWIALRSRTKRIETRILESQAPAAPPTPPAR
jgi:hypothetical protein